jgi:hypothetical protein
MIEDSRIFVDVMESIVESVRIEYAKLPVSNDADEPYYLYGHYQSIADELIKKSLVPATRGKKYPLILLGIDPEYRETKINDMQYEVSCNLWIIEETKQAWFTTERFDNVFKPILYPLRNLLEKAIFESKYVSSRLVDIKPDWDIIPYWGTQTVQGSDSQIIDDPLDAMKCKLNNLIVNINC